MDAEKALERIQLLLMRTEERGASPAEADTAARMVCKLLTQFPTILKPQPVHQRSVETNYDNKRPPFPGNETVSVRYQFTKKQTAKAVLVVINGKEVWLPLNQITFKTAVIWMPRWLAQAKGLI